VYFNYVILLRSLFRLGVATRPRCVHLESKVDEYPSVVDLAGIFTPVVSHFFQGVRGTPTKSTERHGPE